MGRWVLRDFTEHEAKPLRVVADGAVGAQGVAGGRLIPVLILDARERPDFEENVKLHKGRGLGDVKSTWMAMPGVSDACLLLEFSGHTKVNIVIAFEVGTQYLLVDQILRSKSVLLQPGKPGDRVKDTFGVQPSISVEVNGEWPAKVWEKILTKAFIKSYKKEGFNNKTAKELAFDRILAWRKISNSKIA